MKLASIILVGFILSPEPMFLVVKEGPPIKVQLDPAFQPSFLPAYSTGFEIVLLGPRM